ncbi:MAG: glycosyltransferase family 4 protein [Bacteroidota bacterium]|nr:glycosyltransferase family 4 protein [Bacteroidota bacterium]
MKSIKPRLLIFIEWFTPAYKAGGPIRAIENLSTFGYSLFDIYIFTGDHDLGDHSPLQNVTLNKWTLVQNEYNVFFADRSMQQSKSIASVIMDLKPDTIYLNSMYAIRFSLRPLLTILRLPLRPKIVLAPRGMLKDSALKFKWLKKRIFLSLLKSTRILNQVLFHATDDQENQDIQKKLNISAANIRTVPDVPISPEYSLPTHKESGSAVFIFVGRIHPIKGLDFILELLPNVKGEIELKVVGWAEDMVYYKSCIRMINSLPVSVTVSMLGDLPFTEVIKEIQSSHFLLSPTHGENFGHAIYEAMSVGRPVIISNQTPWKKLAEMKCGWDIPLERKDLFFNAIQLCVDMTPEEYESLSTNAFQFAKQFFETSELKEKYLSLLSPNIKLN